MRHFNISSDKINPVRDFPYSLPFALATQLTRLLYTGKIPTKTTNQLRILFDEYYGNSKFDELYGKNESDKAISLSSFIVFFGLALHEKLTQFVKERGLIKKSQDDPLECPEDIKKLLAFVTFPCEIHYSYYTQSGSLHHDMYAREEGSSEKIHIYLFISTNYESKKIVESKACALIDPKEFHPINNFVQRKMRESFCNNINKLCEERLKQRRLETKKWAIAAIQLEKKIEIKKGSSEALKSLMPPEREHLILSESKIRTPGTEDKCSLYSIAITILNYIHHAFKEVDNTEAQKIANDIKKRLTPIIKKAFGDKKGPFQNTAAHLVPNDMDPLYKTENTAVLIFILGEVFFYHIKKIGYEYINYNQMNNLASELGISIKFYSVCKEEEEYFHGKKEKKDVYNNIYPISSNQNGEEKTHPLVHIHNDHIGAHFSALIPQENYHLLCERESLNTNLSSLSGEFNMLRDEGKIENLSNFLIPKLEKILHDIVVPQKFDSKPEPSTKEKSPTTKAENSTLFASIATYLAYLLQSDKEEQKAMIIEGLANIIMNLIPSDFFPYSERMNESFPHTMAKIIENLFVRGMNLSTRRILITILLRNLLGTDYQETTYILDILSEEFQFTITCIAEKSHKEKRVNLSEKSDLDKKGNIIIPLICSLPDDIIDDSSEEVLKKFVNVFGQSKKWKCSLTNDDLRKTQLISDNTCKEILFNIDSKDFNPKEIQDKFIRILKKCFDEEKDHNKSEKKILQRKPNKPAPIISAQEATASSSNTKTKKSENQAIPKDTHSEVIIPSSTKTIEVSIPETQHALQKSTIIAWTSIGLLSMSIVNLLKTFDNLTAPDQKTALAAILLACFYLSQFSKKIEKLGTFIFMLPAASTAALSLLSQDSSLDEVILGAAMPLSLGASLAYFSEKEFPGAKALYLLLVASYTTIASHPWNAVTVMFLNALPLATFLLKGNRLPTLSVLNHLQTYYPGYLILLPIIAINVLHALSGKENEGLKAIEMIRELILIHIPPTSTANRILLKQIAEIIGKTAACFGFLFSIIDECLKKHFEKRESQATIIASQGTFANYNRLEEGNAQQPVMNSILSHKAN